MLHGILSLIVPPLCLACGADAGRAAPLCTACRTAMQPLSFRGGCFAAFPYEGPAGALVRALKFGGRVALAEVMAAQLAVHTPAELLRGAIVPVPVHARH